MIRSIVRNLRKIELTKAEKVYLSLFLSTTSIVLLSYPLEPTIRNIMMKQIYHDRQVLVSKLNLLIKQDETMPKREKIRDISSQLAKRVEIQFRSPSIHEITFNDPLSGNLSNDLVSNFNQDITNFLDETNADFNLLIEEMAKTDRFFLPINEALRRSSSSTAYLLQIPYEPNYLEFLNFSYLSHVMMINSLNYIRLNEIQNAIYISELSGKLVYMETPFFAEREQFLSHNYLRIALVLRKLPNVPVGTYRKFSKHDPKLRKSFVSAVNNENVSTAMRVHSSVQRDLINLTFSLQRVVLYHGNATQYLLRKDRITNLISSQEKEGCRAFLNKISVLLDKDRSGLLDFISTGLYIDLIWEHTLKILQTKELASMAGKYPDRIAGIEQSQVCPDLSYTYRVLDNGTRMSLSLKQAGDFQMIDDRREWFRYRTKKWLTYETKLPIKKFQN